MPSQKKSLSGNSTILNISANVPMKRTHSTSVIGEDDKTPSRKDTIVVYCDGACKGNGKVGSVAGIGVWWGNNDSRCVIPTLQLNLLM